MISTANMSHEEWLELRRSGIGGSDAGAICGLNPYSGPISVYYDKAVNTKQKEDEEDNEAMRQGRDLEEYVAKRFTEKTGLKVRRSNFMYRNEENPFMIANVDRLVVGEDAGLECKTTSAFNANKWNGSKIPPYYALQAYHYMAVTGKRNWYIAVVILGRGFQYMKLTWDEEIIQNLTLIEKNFWENHVVAGVIPPPDGSEISDKILEQYFHTSKKNAAISLTGFDEKLDRRNQIGILVKKLEQEQKQIEQEIKLFMGEHEYAQSEKYKVSWTNVNSLRLDTKRIQEAHPDLCKDFLKESCFRKFTVKTT